MKFIGTLLTTALLGAVVSAGTASAAPWDQSSLALYVYNENNNQVAVSLLEDAATFDFTQQNVTLAGAGTVNLGQFPGISSWGALSMGAEAAYHVSGTDYTEWFVTTNPLAPPAVSGSNLLSFHSMNGSVKSGASGADPGDSGVSVLPSSNQLSYDYVANKNSTVPGGYGGFNSDFADGEAILDALDVPGAYMDMYLYRFNLTTADAAGNPYAAVLRLSSDGSVILNPTVPEPASLALIGTALLGLVGVRRKFSA